MGADLIAFIMKGPAKVTAARRKAALRAVDKFLAAGADLISAYDTLKMVEEETKGWDEITQEDLTRCRKVVDDLTSHRDSVLYDYLDDRWAGEVDDAVAALREMAESFNPEEFVDEFIGWWVGGARDTSSRPDPDDRKQQIVVCGDMSWGDPPSGYGYTLTNRAYWYHIPQALGIR